MNATQACLLTMSITAIVLAGGQGSRMNHEDKAWVSHLGKPLILHVLERITTYVDQIVISRNSDNQAYETLGYKCVSDLYADYQGPLAGIASCAPGVDTEFTLVVPCDTPSLPSDLVERLSSRISGTDIVVASHAGKIEPLIFLARTETLDSIPAYLSTQRRSVMGWLESNEYREARFENDSRAFENINKTSQLQK